MSILNFYLNERYITKNDFEKYEKVYVEIEKLHKTTDFSKFKYIKQQLFLKFNEIWFFLGILGENLGFPLKL